MIRAIDEEEQVRRTNDDGRYEFTGLRPGEYDGFVEAGEFRATHLPSSLSSAGGATRPRPIVLRDSDVRVNLDVALQRALAITVRVVNEWGEPLSAVGVSVHAENGGNSFSATMPRSTDDRGRVRLFRIPPGRYIVCAAANSIAYSGESSSRRERFLRTCYPSAAGEAQAEQVALERSDIEDLEIRMRRGRTFTISGTVVDASGAAASAATLIFTQVHDDGSSSGGTRPDASGRFTIANVPPGEYAIEASLGGPDRPEQRRDLELGFQRIRVGELDIDGLVVAMAKAADVAGRVVPEEPAVPLERPDEGTIFIFARPAGERSLLQHGVVTTHSGNDRVFVLTGLFGRRILEVANVPRGWYVKSIRYRGEEIIDVPAEFKAGTDPSELQVILSTRGAMVSGRVLDDRGEVVPGAQVVLLPADPSRWTLFQLNGESSSETGAFRVGPQRAGDYLIVALPASGRFPDPDDQARLAQLMESAERISLGSDEQRSLDLHVIKER